MPEKQKRKPSRYAKLVGQYMDIVKVAGRPQHDVREAFKEATRVVKDVITGRLDLAGLRAAALVHRRLLATDPSFEGIGKGRSPIGVRLGSSHHYKGQYIGKGRYQE